MAGGVVGSQLCNDKQEGHSRPGGRERKAEITCTCTAVLQYKIRCASRDSTNKKYDMMCEKKKKNLVARGKWQKLSCCAHHTAPFPCAGDKVNISHYPVEMHFTYHSVAVRSLLLSWRLKCSAGVQEKAQKNGGMTLL